MEIEQLKLEQKTTNIAKLKDNFIKNFNELKMVQKQNEMIMNQNNEIQKQKELLEEDRKDLIFNLEKMNEDFRIFQLNREKELQKLKDQLPQTKEKNLSNNNSKTIMAKKISTSTSKINKNENSNINKNFAEVEHGIKKMSEEVNSLKKERYTKDEKIKLLNEKLKNVTEDRNSLNIQLNDFITNLEKSENKRKIKKKKKKQKIIYKKK